MDKIITFEKLLDYHAEGLSTQPISIPTYELRTIFKQRIRLSLIFFAPVLRFGYGLVWVNPSCFPISSCQDLPISTLVDEALLDKHFSEGISQSIKKEEPRPEKKMRLSFDRIGALLVNSIIHQHSNLR